jgi:hypothetical protein
VEHYWCHWIYITKTRATRVSNAVNFVPNILPCPKCRPPMQLTHALLNPAPAAQYAALSQAQQQALEALAEIFRPVKPRQLHPRVLTPVIPEQHQESHQECYLHSPSPPPKIPLRQHRIKCPSLAQPVLRLQQSLAQHLRGCQLWNPTPLCYLRGWPMNHSSILCLALPPNASPAVALPLFPKTLFDHLLERRNSAVYPPTSDTITHDNDPM